MSPKQFSPILLLLLSFVCIISKATADQRHQTQNFTSLRVQVSPSKGRIIGGDEVKPHSLPFQAGLLINGNAFCGGALISPNYVLTAGHCAIAMTRGVQVTLGAHNRSDSTEPTQTIPGKTVILHEKYDDVLLHNDIALVELTTPAVLNDAVQPIKLAQKTDCVADDPDCYLAKKVVASGWGLDHDVPFPTIRDTSDVLQSVEVVVIDVEQCGLYYNDEDGDYVLNTNVCTSGYKNRGTCDGDSGGPLTLNGALIGVTSFGTNECEMCSPSVYTKVVDYLDWIQQHSDVKLS